MKTERLGTIAFAQGWVETQLQYNLDEAEESDKKIAQELFDSFMIVSNGIDELRRENADLVMKLTAGRNALA